MGVIFRGFWSLSPSETPHFALTEVTPPTDEPVTLEQAKIELRRDVLDTYFDTSITAQIVAARQQVEKDTSQFIARATYDLIFDGQAPSDGIFRIPYGPIDSITSVTVYDWDEVGTVVDEGSYTFDGVSRPTRLVLYTDVDDPAFSVEIRDTQTTFIRFIGGPAEVTPDQGDYVAPAWGVQAIYRLLEYWRTKDPDLLASYYHLIDTYRLVEVA